MTKRTASEKIGSFVEALDPEAVSQRVVHQVARAFLDTFGVAVAARAEPASRMAREYVTAGGRSGPATIWATGEKVDLEAAALVNGIMAHVFDYDDVTPMFSGHPSAVLLPALVALGEAENSTGGQISAAYAAGFEVVAKLPVELLLAHYVRGWHSTSTIGLIRAAISCAHLLRLDAGRTAAAIGIALAHVGGVHKSFGTMCKSLQPGNAASAAIRSARLAAAGFTGPCDALDGKLGFTDVYIPGYDLHPYLETLGQGALELERSGLAVKRFPSCYCTHRAIQGAIDLGATKPIDPSRVEMVRVTVEPHGLSPLIHHRPQRGLEGKFSMEYCVAVAILDGGVRLESFVDQAVQRPEVQALLQKVEACEGIGEILPRRATLEVELDDGEQRSIHVEDLRGTQIPLTDAEVEGKLRDCVAFSHLEIDLDAFASAVLDWRNHPIRQILAVVQGD